MLSVLHQRLEPKILWGRQKLLTSTKKLQVGMIVPDLVAIISTSSRIGSHKPRALSFFDCGVMAEVLKRKSVTEAALPTLVYARRSIIEASVKKLLAAKLLTKHSGKLRCRRTLNLSSLRIISVEAKLIRWREAISQALSYKAFSNAAYLALPEPVAARRNIRAQCRQKGIGLIAVHGKDCKLVARARLTKQYSPEWLWILNKLVGLRV